VRYCATWLSPSVTLFNTYAATMRWPSAYCATSIGTSTSSMRPSTQPVRPDELRTSHQSSRSGGGGTAAAEGFMGAALLSTSRNSCAGFGGGFLGAAPFCVLFSFALFSGFGG